jgi:hypothetical protein
VCASRRLCVAIVVSKLVPVLLLVACTEAPPRMVVDPDLAAMEADYIIFGLTDNVTRGGSTGVSTGGRYSPDLSRLHGGSASWKRDVDGLQ